MQKPCQSKSKSQTLYEGVWIKYDMSGEITHHTLKGVRDCPKRWDKTKNQTDGEREGPQDTIN